MSFTVAIIGRPNVGKSTLFNRLTGKRHAIVHDMPGVTRDRRYGEGRVGPLEFRIIDTAGLDADKSNEIYPRMLKMTEAAMLEADVIMLVVDARAGITEEDKFFAKRIRKHNKPIVLVLNKSEAGHGKGLAPEAYRLGFGDPVPISAEHGEGMADLYNALAPFENKQEEDASGMVHTGEEEDEFAPDDEDFGIHEVAPKDEILQIAIIGRPNVGKSTLMNALLGEERVLAGPQAGLTRDAITVDFSHAGRPLKLVDTAGMRKKSNVINKVEKLAVADSLRAIQYAHVVVLLIDATQPLEKQDNAIAALVEREGRAMVLAVNKWDQVEDKQQRIKDIIARLSDVMSQMKNVPVIPISALTGRHVDKLMAAVFSIYGTWNTRVGTGALNRWLEAMVDSHSPPLVDGRRIKMRYITQTKARPPTFLLFTNQIEKMPDAYQRYLVAGLRERFNLPGVPIRLNLRKSKNPYSKEK